MRITPETTMEAMVAHIKTPNPGNLYTSEDQFQKDAVEEYLKHLGWSYFHDKDSRKNNPGFPDLMAWRGERMLAIELKLSPKSKLSMDQYITLHQMSLTPVEVYLWLPWEDEILEALNRV